ncbi:glycerophosphodiester phosphodiesterase [Campylobacter sp. MIT 12-5580]|uniref:esterase-like activity of phytase family protein n=1 Tax=Campylobacter sp. MIT 12-5580 TaxID=2040651 RepID=UPI0010F59FC9|nr:esterase-like activity of phytase family protein [Campylobacter sp. MIT 12-5580]TKX28818.1 glycerophosphodiester phosphodiesterase [Campylobacter sp. MIT 12-5580]
MLKKIALGLSLSLSLLAAKEYEARLAGHIVIKADEKIKPPKDAPEFLHTAGKFFNGTREEKLHSFEAQYLPQDRIKNFKIPFKDQAVQGHSGIKYLGNDEIYIITDNGLGTKANSADNMLFISKYKLDFKNSSYQRLQTIFFKDTNKKSPYKITLEGTKERYLTGADFDPESFQIIKGEFWVGEEFGPFLLHFDKNGVLKEVFETYAQGAKLLSPDHPSLELSSKPQSKQASFNVRRSKGFEAMASSKDGSFLYPMLEGALFINEEYENEKGKQFTRILEFDVAKKKFTNKSYKYFFEENDHAIGDFNMIDEKYALVIERDNSSGVKDKLCKTKDTSKCFESAAKFKRIYKIKLDEKSGIAQKIAYIDLMKIKDTHKLSKKPLVDGNFVFPFFTIEDVDIVDSSHIIVANDNNFPFSDAREPNKSDDNEIILLEVKDFLEAR